MKTQLITTAAAVTLTGIPHSTLRRIRTENEIGTRLGRDYFFSPSDLKKILRAKKLLIPGRKRRS